MDSIEKITGPLWRDGYHAAARLIERQDKWIKELSKEYLAICDNDCRGDSTVGIPSCPFFEWPDIDADGKLIPGGCRIRRGGCPDAE